MCCCLALAQKEKNEFVQGVKFKDGTSLLEKSLEKEDDYYYGVEKAFDDAFNQYARRNGKKYAQSKQKLMEPIVKRLYKYFNAENDNFDVCFNDCIQLSKNILNNNLYGIAQKITNMSFKYLYCYQDMDAFKDKFEKCHLPLDKYTINWIKSLQNNTVNNGLKKIKNAWANIEQPLYNDIQKLVDDTLKTDTYTYRISFNETANEQTCVLPKNKLLAEFIIWHQEHLNELHLIIERHEKDFDRLGIQWLKSI